MLKRKALIVLTTITVVVSGCTSEKSQKEDRATTQASDVIGKWQAQWVTDPSSYPDVDPSVNFTMNGKFEFDSKGKVTISAYGYKGCIFSSDTLVHSLNWKLKNDTLQLVNENDVHGMTYSVLNLSTEKMKLQLMDDIFLNLSKL
ncbi:lipocalin family protein [Reichenbachiella sp. MALMAid0571]|uniref:lipocalin family protein n=1 Tax=Reichenbachiella sp. MALMAid0571 TaxID=3143939 RepID=UPI0032DF41B5